MKDDDRELKRIESAIKALHGPGRLKILLLLKMAQRKGLTERELLGKFPPDDARHVLKDLTVVREAGFVKKLEKEDTDPASRPLCITDHGENWLQRIGIGARPEAFLAVIEKQLLDGRK